MTEANKQIVYTLRLRTSRLLPDIFCLVWEHDGRAVGMPKNQRSEQEQIAHKIALEDPDATCWYHHGASWKTESAALAARDRIMNAITSMSVEL